MFVVCVAGGALAWRFFVTPPNLPATTNTEPAPTIGEIDKKQALLEFLQKNGTSTSAAEKNAQLKALGSSGTHATTEEKVRLLQQL